MKDGCYYDNEKSGLLRHDYDNLTNKYRKRDHFRTGLYIAVALFVWWSFDAIPSLLGHNGPYRITDGSEKQGFLFEDIVPSEKLEWHPCYSQMGNFCCARLTVPMDYHRPLNASEENPKVYIALVLIPGNHTGPKKYSTSPLLLNPGGPGGSGVTFGLGVGSQIQAVVGAEQDVIGFDPRGIGATTPRADCFSYPVEGSTNDSSSYENEDYIRGNFHRLMWQIGMRDIGLVNSSSDSLEKIDTRARTVAKLCQAKTEVNGNDSIMKYVHTPSVARDMISIIDAWDEWTASFDDNEAEAVEDPKTQIEESEFTDSSDSLSTKGKLVYWGFSYGTLLGATFASMFPERVGRVVLDGVVDADYYVSPVWAESLIDTDAIYHSFSEYCHRAKELCYLYRVGDEVKDVEDRFSGVLNAIKETPLSLIDQYTNTPIIVTSSDIRSVLFSTLYSPTATFPLVAWMINMAYLGDYTALAAMFTLPEIDPYCGTPLPAYSYPNDAQNAIMCSDKRYPLDETLPNLEKRFERMTNVSTFADIWMTLMIGCDSWGITPVDPPMRWDDHPAHKQKPINTSYPVLFISNTADPVTPLNAGVKMAKKFVDAGLLEQKSEGHCSLSAVSKCTIKKVREYFAEGKVPPPPIGKYGDGNWEKCEADEWPFHPFHPEVMTAQAHTEEERAVIASMFASKKMQEAFNKMKFFGAGLDAKLLLFTNGFKLPDLAQGKW